MKKTVFTVMIFAASLSAALLTGCGGKKSDAQASSAAETSQSESETQESVVELVESAPEGAAIEDAPSGSGDPQELRTNKVSVGKLTVDGDSTTYEGKIFSTSFYTDDFTVDDESEEDVVTLYYMGDAAHEPYVRVEYIEGADAGELKDEIRLMEGDHVIDATSQMAMTSEPVTTLVVQKVADDGYTDYYAYYVFEYGTGCVKITAATYFDDDDDDSTMAISDAISMVFDAFVFGDVAANN